MEQIEPTPCVKWAGGKRQLLTRIGQLKPKSYKAYFEPFFGGGAVFFHLKPEDAYINDINESLVSMYKAIAVSPEEVIELVDEVDKGWNDSPKEYYYSLREKYNHKLSEGLYDVESAALFLCLNKHCFNGLYRVNSKGLFNVPYNNSTARSINPDNIRAISGVLKHAHISCGDFAAPCKHAEQGDFVFFDSPYAPIKDTSFEAYTKEGFALEEHERLAGLFKELTERGVSCMLTNHDTSLIRDLYSDYTIESISVRRSINSNASKRSGTEVIVTNY